MQDEQQMQPMRNESMNAPIMEVTQRVEVDIQHQIAIKQVVQRNQPYLQTLTK
jgi:hypothetical protein